MVGIATFVGGEGSRDPNIEDTLRFASIEGMERSDLRVLAVLVTWFGVHSAGVNADRLIGSPCSIQRFFVIARVGS